MIFKDQLGESVELKKVPTRIVSLVPSQTELLYDLGVAPVAQTLFCVHPRDKFKNAIKIGGTKKLNIDKIKSLRPDLIIGNKEENTREQIDLLKEVAPVWMSDINTVEDALSMIRSIGELTGKSEMSNRMANDIELRFNRLLTHKSSKTSYVYLIWQEPLMAVGTSTYINDVLTQCGYCNLVTDERYPEMSLERIGELSPTELLLSTEPFPFKEDHVKWFQEQLPKSRIRLIDAEMVSWYGSRMLKAAKYLEMFVDG